MVFLFIFFDEIFTLCLFHVVFFIFFDEILGYIYSGHGHQYNEFNSILFFDHLAILWSIFLIFFEEIFFIFFDEIFFIFFDFILAYPFKEFNLILWIFLRFCQYTSLYCSYSKDI